MRVAVKDSRLVADWKTGVVASGAKPFRTSALLPKLRVVWNGNPFCEPGSVLYLPGHPGTGASIFDFSGQGNTGTIYGATWTRLPSGLWCLSFDGVDDYVSITEVSGLAFTNASDFSILAWVNKGDSSRGIIIGDYLSGAVGTISLEVFTDGIIRTYLQTTDAYVKDYRSGGAVTYGRFSLVGSTYAGATQTIHIYIDTVDQDLTKTRDETLNGSLRSGSGFKIGKDNRPDPSAIWFDGLIGELTIYNRVLSALEIANHFNRERHLFGV